MNVSFDAGAAANDGNPDVFTIRRQGVPPQEHRLAVFFKGDELDRWEGDQMPTEADFVATLDTYSEVELTPKTVAFVKAFKARFHKAPTYTAATYDAITLLKESIEKAGSADPDKLVPVLEQTSSVGTAAHLEFTKTHDPVWGIGKSSGIAVQWQDGEKVPFWPPQVKGMKAFKLPGARQAKAEPAK